MVGTETHWLRFDKALQKHYFACKLTGMITTGWGFAQYSQQVVAPYVKRCKYAYS
jgi:hypothetical protein